MLTQVLKDLPENSKVLDFGCFGFKVVEISHTLNRVFSHSACDITRPRQIPDGVEFHVFDVASQKLNVNDDHFDLVVASHVIEHSAEPLKLFRELARVTKPGGHLYLEAPSDRALLQKSDADVESHTMYSFWDEPTHLRPWPPAAFYRLAIMHGLKPLECRYLQSKLEKILLPFKWLKSLFTGERHALKESLWLANGWAAAALIEKPVATKGVPEFGFLSLKDVPRGVEAALALRREL